MNDRDALIRAVLLHPAEDAPKVALADWYEEHGTPEERARASWMRIPAPPTARDQAVASAWAGYVAGLLPAGVLPKCATPMILHVPRDGAAADSWPNGMELLVGGGLYCKVRHGFVVSVAAARSRLTRSLPKLVAAQPIHDVAQCYATYTSDPSETELGPVRVSTYSIPNGVLNCLEQLAFPTAAEARRGVSRAWVNWARSKAGLPELP